MAVLAGEREFEIKGAKLAAKEWGEAGHFPVIALHGWLDNCASFDVLAPLLEKVHIIGLDSIGHGRSTHRRDHGPYNIWQDMSDLYQVVEQLGWKQFALLGHSRGAMISTLFAGTFPERVTHLAVIDSIFPMSVESEKAPEQLRQSIVATGRKISQRLTRYDDVESAIEARQQSKVPISEVAAKYLMSRGLTPVENGYTWSTDPRLLLPSAVKFSTEQIDSFMKKISAKSCMILANDGLPDMYKEHKRLLQRYPEVQVVEMSGGHHLHLGEGSKEIAQLFNEFFSK